MIKCIPWFMPRRLLSAVFSEVLAITLDRKLDCYTFTSHRLSDGWFSPRRLQLVTLYHILTIALIILCAWCLCHGIPFIVASARCCVY